MRKAPDKQEILSLLKWFVPPVNVMDVGYHIDMQRRLFFQQEFLFNRAHNPGRMDHSCQSELCFPDTVSLFENSRIIFNPGLPGKT